MERSEELRELWQSNVDKIMDAEDVIDKLKDISTYGGYTITITKSKRGTAVPVKVELKASIPGDLEISTKVMAEVIRLHEEKVTALRQNNLMINAEMFKLKGGRR